MRFFKFQSMVNNVPFDKENFLAFSIVEGEEDNIAITKIYTTQYYQRERSNYLNGVKNTGLTIDEIYNKMQDINASDEDDWFTDYLTDFEHQYSIDQFREDTLAEKCYYCHITKNDIKTLVAKKMLFKKNERGFTMEIDRKKPNLEYTNDNCVPACYWCNNAKTDEFDDEEFIPIAKQIKAVFDKRLNS
ncbi:MAG: hypothetical protein B6I18_03370 [Bacteroidetes bacterium 4572_112]|nr:MAG: hypothetical protein B6I18_03370 [Bacteroidetes bacterium 4572_112]